MSEPHGLFQALVAGWVGASMYVHGQPLSSNWSSVSKMGTQLASSFRGGGECQPPSSSSSEPPPPPPPPLPPPPPPLS